MLRNIFTNDGYYHFFVCANLISEIWSLLISLISIYLFAMLRIFYYFIHFSVNYLLPSVVCFSIRWYSLFLYIYENSVYYRN